MCEYINGDLLYIDVDYIAHQCNCITSYGKGLYKDIVNKYPDVDIYKQRTQNSVPGTICVMKQEDVDSPSIIHMFAQYSYSYANNKINDSRANRLEWFAICLDKISSIKNVKSIAFPKGVGCGMAGGKWENYDRLLNVFATKNKDIKVYIVNKIKG